MNTDLKNYKLKQNKDKRQLITINTVLTQVFPKVAAQPSLVEEGVRLALEKSNL